MEQPLMILVCDSYDCSNDNRDNKDYVQECISCGKHACTGHRLVFSFLVRARDVEANMNICRACYNRFYKTFDDDPDRALLRAFNAMVGAPAPEPKEEAEIIEDIEKEGS